MNQSQGGPPELVTIFLKSGNTISFPGHAEALENGRFKIHTLAPRSLPFLGVDDVEAIFVEPLPEDR